MMMQSTGSLVMALRNTRMPGAFSAGASVSSRMCSASSIRPSPIETRPTSLIHERPPLRKATRPMANSTGATAEILNDSTWTISVVPTLAPSMIASAGTRLTRPSAAKELVIRAVAVLLCNSAVMPMPAAKAAKRFFSARVSSTRRSGPNARRIPLWTMCRPHSSSATPPIRSSRTRLPIGLRFPNLSRTLKLSANDLGSTLYSREGDTKSGVAAAQTRAQGGLDFLRSLCRVEGCEAALEVGLEIPDILEPDVEPQRRPARRPFGGGAVAVAIEGNHKALEAAPGIAHAKKLDGVEQGIDRLLRRRLQHDAEQARGAGKIPLPDRVARIAFERRMQHPDDLGPV